MLEYLADYFSQIYRLVLYGLFYLLRGSFILRLRAEFSKLLYIVDFYKS